MRITSKVSGAGSNGLARIPFLDISSIDKELCTDGHLDEAKCRRALSHDVIGVQIGSDDCLPVFAFATELLKQVANTCRRMIEERRTGNNKDAHATAECADDRHAERNMEKDRYLYVRSDISYLSGRNSIKLRINIDNPRGVVGVAERIALDYALIMARVANNIRSQLESAHGKWGYEFVGGPGCPTIFDDARKIDSDLNEMAAVKKSNLEMWKCNRRTASGDCSPCKFDCEHYCNGKCVEIKKREV